MKVVGGSLSGIFMVSSTLALTKMSLDHTFSTASRFTIHRLTLDSNDATGTTYMLDVDRWQ